MRTFIKTTSLAVLFVLSTLGTMRADSITPSVFQGDSQIVQADLSHFQFTPSYVVAVFDYSLGKAAGQQGIFALSIGDSKLAQIYFQTAITDFNNALAALGQGSLPNPSGTVPEAGSLALLGFTGIALFGALARKYSKQN
jgi:hypothetical protein